MTLYWYVILDGKTLPTPYQTLEEAREAAEELKSRICNCLIDFVYQ